MGTAGIEPAHSVMPWTSHGLAQGATLANFQSWLMFPEGEYGIRTHAPKIRPSKVATCPLQPLE